MATAGQEQAPEIPRELRTARETAIGATLSWALDNEQRKDYLARIQAYMTKAVNEAKVNMSWINPEPGIHGGAARTSSRVF